MLDFSTPMPEGTATPTSLVDSKTFEKRLRSAMRAAGLEPREPIKLDGRLHRYDAHSDRTGSKNAWYVGETAGISFGCFGSWKTGYKEIVYAKSKTVLTKEERQELARRIKESDNLRREEELIRRQAARDRASQILNNSSIATDCHPYLLKKGIKNHGLCLYRGSLIIPLYSFEGVIQSLQFINSKGEKRFLADGIKKGCFFFIGTLGETLCICEGYATGASVYEATGIATAIAFDAGNLTPVSVMFRRHYPHITIIVCADNDTMTEGNPGLTHARQAAAMVNGLLAIAGGI